MDFAVLNNCVVLTSRVLSHSSLISHVTPQHSSPPTLPSNSELSSEKRALLNNFTTIILHILSISPVLNKTIKLIQKAETGATLDTFCWTKNNHQSESSGRRETSTYTGMYYHHQVRENTISVSSFL